MSRTSANLGPAARYAERLQASLLVCGLLSSLLYVATDILGGIRYDGYSFTSQAVSELMAIGAPSERLVDPLFLAYGILVIAFGVGILETAGRHRRALRLTGLLLIAYGALGLTGPTLFEMYPRGSSGGRSDLPHIILTAVISLVALAAIGIAAFGLGKRFRNYSFATLILMISAGGLAASYGPRMAAGEPTPGFGIIERVDIYAALLWIAVLAVALLRRRSAQGSALVLATG